MNAKRVPGARSSLTILAAIAVIASLQPEEVRSVVPEPTNVRQPPGPAVAAPRMQSADALVRRLGSPDATERAMAACRLARMNSEAVERARDRLLELLSDGTAVEGRLCRERWNRWNERHREPSSPGREAAMALEELGTEVVDRVVEVLRGQSPTGRENAAFALGLVESPRAVAPLRRVLREDGVASVRARAAWALGMIEDRDPVSDLTAALGDDTVEVRKQAAWALGMIESPSAVDGLIAALRDDPSSEVRKQAAWALGMIESSAAVPGLATAIRDENADVREQAAWALGMIESPAGVEPLLPALRDEASDVREQAAWALGMIESSSAVEGLIEVLRDDPSAEVREQAAWALGMIEDPAAVPAIVTAIEDDDPDVREQAMWALSMLMDSGGFGDIDRGDLADALRRALQRRP